MIEPKKCGVLVVILILCFEIRGQYDYELGDTCPTSTGSGICSYLIECKSAREGIKRGMYPNICAFKGTVALVCCQSTSTPTPTPIRVTPRQTPEPDTRPVTVTNPTVANGPGGKANAMCKAYSQYAYEKIESPTLEITTSFSSILECPITTQSLIVGGTLAERKEFPHMVQIGYGPQPSWDCGGTLISENFVLTAAHCMQGTKGEARQVRGGITNQTADILHLQVRNVVQRIKYPQYGALKYHDIALLKVDRNFDINTFLRPACLYTEKNFPVTHPIASGWGLTDFAADEGSQELLKVTLEFFTTANCNKTYRRMINMQNSVLPNGIVEDYMICAGSTKERKDTCQGDSGGPLQSIRADTKDVKCMYNIIGVTSFGVACGLAKNLPGVYTRVSYYIKWIEDIVWPYL